MIDATITAFLARAAEKGWHMRPDEATKEMSAAGAGAGPPGMQTGGPETAFQIAWRAMTLAAPPFDTVRFLT